MPSKHISKRWAKEYPILYARRPFCLTSAADFNLDFLKTSLVDENLALQLNLPIKHLQYQRFSLSKDKSVWSRLVGTCKLTAQIIEKGSAGKSFQLSAKVIRNLTEITGAEAVCDAVLEEKLFTLPVLEEKPEKRVRKWLQKQGHGAPSQAPFSVHPKLEDAPSSWPPSTATPFYSQCRCDWSAASTHGTACCKHKGPCQHCINNLADVATEVDNFSEGPPDLPVHADNFTEGSPDQPIPDLSKEELDILKNYCDIDDSDTEDAFPTSFEDGCILQDGAEELVFLRMTGDRLREFHAKHYSPFGAEESDLRELDKIRRFYEMEFPGKPCIFAHYGDLDVYLDEEWKKLNLKKAEARKKARRDLKKRALEELEGEGDDANLRPAANRKAGFPP